MEEENIASEEQPKGEEVEEGDKNVEGQADTETRTDEQTEDQEGLEGEATERTEGDTVVGEHDEQDELLGEHKELVMGEGEEIMGEELEGEHVEGEETEKKEPPPPVEEEVEEEEGYVEEPPPDPTAAYDLTDSKEALKPPFELRPEQLAEVEQLWDFYQNCTPAYADLDGYITEKELVYMLKCLMLMTVTPEQLQELIVFCVRPPHPQGHIIFEQFLKMVTIRQRDFPVEEELRTALQVMDPGRTGTIDREFLKETLSKLGYKMPQKQLDNLIKEVDMSNDGTIGIEDVVGTMCIDLNKEDLLMLMASLQPPEEQAPAEEP
ncbi:unnamed protein product [Pieris brassicae]|uniref:EF-hand domain-containing protein n=2 Tax=Pieris brassicae TaxID=7116 RepID=A0A9P0X5W8_PIEBR|nr:unnamed protein product [Pieris brassicae]